MKRAAFATLCGVSKQMISKYAASGFVIENADGVDAAASLAALDGRLDEAKRQAALAALASLEGAQPPAAISASAGVTLRPSAKAEKDEVELKLKRLQYGREAGELVNAEDVDIAARQAVTRMREVFGNRRREIADGVCAQFGVPAEKASALARHLAREFELAMGAFAEDMAALGAGDAAGPAGAASSEAALAV